MDEFVLIEYYFKCFRHYIDFSGRANRKEFWTFVVVNIIISIPFIILFLSGMWDYEECNNSTMLYIGAVLLFLWTVITGIPKISAAVRRLHDTGRSGFWLLILFLPGIGSLILITLLLLKGDDEENKYGFPPSDLFE
ncbi:DUF805 domain-containing protein [Falsiporphyromonas endometrii]|uniref:DUF805 domain-containing protein n=1 Tax=Falsiporphyromonas endometrii TaxID=1387297 RepID=A0ABV9K889_9PORP|nr:DUF805 domain-containing protein [Porphyromonadaceae bacterium]